MNDLSIRKLVIEEISKKIRKYINVIINNDLIDKSEIKSIELIKYGNNDNQINN